MKRAVLIATGVVLVVLGLVVAAAGGAAAALFGSDGSLATAPARVSGSGVALVIEDISIDASSIPVPDGVGTLTLTVADPDDRSMFVGSAPGDVVDTYLTGAPYDVVVELAAGSDGSTRNVPGTQQPPPPTTQPFWTRQASGSPAELTARVSSATTLVVMNSDASPGVTADLVVTLTVARAWTYAWIAVGAGVLLVLLGIVAFWRARVARRRAREASAAPAVATPVVAAPGATILPGSDIGVPAPAVTSPPVAEQAAVIDAAPTAPAATAAAAVAVAAVVAAEPGSEQPPEPDVVAPEVPGAEAVATDDTATDDTAAEDTAAEDTATDEVPPPVDAVPDGPAIDEAAPLGPDADEPVFGEFVGAVAPEEVAAAPVDMADLFAPAGADDATTAIPVVPASAVAAPEHGDTDVADVPPSQPPDPHATGHVAPAGTDRPAG